MINVRQKQNEMIRPKSLLSRLHVVSFYTCRQHFKRKKVFLHVLLSLAWRIIGNGSQDILARQKQLQILASHAVKQSFHMTAAIIEFQKHWTTAMLMYQNLPCASWPLFLCN